MKILYQESKQCQNFIKWKITILNGKIHYNWPFSIAMLNYQRVPDHRPHPIPYRTCCSANETPSETPTAQRNLAEESKLSPPSARAPWSRYMWKIPWNLGYVIWLYICHITLLVEHENRWDLWMFIPQEIHWSTAKKGWTPWIFRWLHRSAGRAPRSNVSARQRGNLFLHGAIQHRKFTVS